MRIAAIGLLAALLAGCATTGGSRPTAASAPQVGIDLAALESYGKSGPTMALTPQHARLAYLMLADLGADGGQMIHGHVAD